MEIQFSKTDLEIGIGIEELKAIALSDIKSRGPRIPSQRTTELYTQIIEAVEDRSNAEGES